MVKGPLAELRIHAFRPSHSDASNDIARRLYTKFAFHIDGNAALDRHGSDRHGAHSSTLSLAGECIPASSASA